MSHLKSGISLIQRSFVVEEESLVFFCFFLWDLRAFCWLNWTVFVLHFWFDLIWFFCCCWTFGFCSFPGNEATFVNSCVALSVGSFCSCLSWWFLGGWLNSTGPKVACELCVLVGSVSFQNSFLNCWRELELLTLLKQVLDGGSRWTALGCFVVVSRWIYLCGTMKYCLSKTFRRQKEERNKEKQI